MITNSVPLDRLLNISVENFWSLSSLKQQMQIYLNMFRVIDLNVFYKQFKYMDRNDVCRK